MAGYVDSHKNISICLQGDILKNTEHFIETLVASLKRNISHYNDVSHDVLHAQRVLHLAEQIAAVEGGDIEIMAPAALFHDIICYPKDSPDSELSPIHSAELAADILQTILGYPRSKIQSVHKIIKNCSFSKNIVAMTIEERIIQDADRLEATGAISIMRTFASTGIMRHMFYNEEDPFCVHRQADSNLYGLDLFYTRLLKIKDMLYTGTAMYMAAERTEFLHSFLKQLRREIL